MASIRSGIEAFRAQLELPPTLELYMMLRHKLNDLHSATKELNRQVHAIQVGKQGILKDIADLEGTLAMWKANVNIQPESARFDSSETCFRLPRRFVL